MIAILQCSFAAERFTRSDAARWSELQGLDLHRRYPARAAFGFAISVHVRDYG
jgi:hypothetical protein